MEELSGQGLDDEVDELSASDSSPCEGDTAGTLTEEDIARGDMTAVAARRCARAQPIRRRARTEPARMNTKPEIGNRGERSEKRDRAVASLERPRWWRCQMVEMVRLGLGHTPQWWRCPMVRLGRRPKLAGIIN